MEPSYITFVITQDIPDMKKLFADRDLFIDQTFIESIFTLKQLYTSISGIYNNSNTMESFMNSIHISVKGSKHETFSTFPHGSTFRHFYSLFYSLVHRDYSQHNLRKERDNVISALLNIPELAKTILKYDFHIAGRQTAVFDSNSQTSIVFLYYIHQRALLISLSITGEMCIWDMKTQKLRHRIPKSHREVFKIRISFVPPNKLLTSTGYNQKMWNIDTGTLIQYLPIADDTSMTSGFEVSSTNIFFATSDGNVMIYDLEGQVQNFIHTRDPYIEYLLSLDNDKLITGSLSVKIWDINTGTVVDTLYNKDSMVNFITKIGNKIIAGMSNGHIEIWDLNTGSKTTFYKEELGYPTKAIVVNNQLIVHFSDQCIYNISIEGADSYKIGYHKLMISIYHFTGKNIISYSPIECVIWNIESCEIIAKFKGKSTSMCVLPNNRMAFGDDKGNIYIIE